MYWKDKLEHEGALDSYKFIDGIWRNQKCYSHNQESTSDAFGFKWSKRNSYESAKVKEKSFKWLVDRYFSGDNTNIENFMKPGTAILDAGCGSGYSALVLFGELLNKVNYLGVDISTSVDIAKQRFLERGIKGEFLQTSLTELPFSKPVFEVIFSEGVLHHTDSTEETFKYLTRLLVPGGKIMFYVYRKKAVIREFTDDDIRNKLSNLTNEEAWNALRPLTQLGKVLGELHSVIHIDKDIDLLGIKAGDIDIQRFFYWYICKAYYSSDFTIEEMNHINFDWFRPLNCHRHTEEEICSWCKSEHMKIEQIKVENAGITTIARKM